MSDASQDVPGDTVAERLAEAVEGLVKNWPTAQTTARVTLEMTEDQWTELLHVLQNAHLTLQLP